SVAVTIRDVGGSQVSKSLSASVRFAAAKSLVFTTAPQILTIGTASSAMTVQLLDVAGNPVNAGGRVVVSLASTSAGVQFMDAQHHVVTSIAIAKGTKSATFFSLDPNTGSPRLTARGAGLVAASQTETVQTAARTLALVGAPTSLTAG